MNWLGVASAICFGAVYVAACVLLGVLMGVFVAAFDREES